MASPSRVMAPSRVQHRLIVTATYLLDKHVRDHELSGEIRSDALFVLGLPHDPERMLAPDVAYVERTPPNTNPDPERPERLLRCAPDLAIEIDMKFVHTLVGPGMTRKPGGRRRIAEYLDAGTRLVWAIDSYRREATLHRADGTTRLVREIEQLDGEDVVPGFQLILADLFDF